MYRERLSRVVVEDYRAGHPRLLPPGSPCRGEAAELHVRERRGFAVERACDLLSGGIAMRVQNAVAAVGGFARQRQLARMPIELRAPADQLPDDFRPLLDQRPHGVQVAESIARDERVLLVEFDVIVFPERDRDTALGVLRRRFLEGVLGDHQNTTRFGKLDGGTQPRYTGADNEKIR